MPARDMAAYMRKRRARQRAEKAGKAQGSHTPRTKASGQEPVVDKALSRDAILKASAGEVAAVRAKIAAIGPGAVITKTGDRLDVLDHETFAARHKPPEPQAVTVYRPPAPPRSMIAVGGRPGRGPAVPGYNPDRAPLDPFAIAHSVNMVTMLSALAAQVDANTREIAALKAAAAKRAETPSFAQALFIAARAFALNSR
jgi:hypothetical protein